jgi:hypothetical protein
LERILTALLDVRDSIAMHRPAIPLSCECARICLRVLKYVSNDLTEAIANWTPILNPITLGQYLREAFGFKTHKLADWSVGLSRPKRTKLADIHDGYREVCVGAARLSGRVAN